MNVIKVVTGLFDKVVDVHYDFYPEVMDTFDAPGYTPYVDIIQIMTQDGYNILPFIDLKQFSEIELEVFAKALELYEEGDI